MNKPKVLVILTILVAAVIAALVFWRAREMRDGDRETIRVSGNLEVTSARLSFKIAGRVLQRLVSEGECVTNGQVVALLDKLELQQEAGMRGAEAQAVQAVLSELEAGTRPEEIAQAAAALELARAEAKRAESEFARQRDLFQQKVISPREIEAAEAVSSMTAAKVREGEARLTLLKQGPRAETVRAARFRLEQVRQALALAETRLGYAALASPLTGIVLAEGVENGEYVVPGTPVVTVGDILHVWLRAYINETDLGRVRIGQAVRITTDTYRGRAYEGRLSFIASQAEFTPKNVQTTGERVKLVYRIKVDVFNPNQELKPGMPADAEIKAR